MVYNKIMLIEEKIFKKYKPDRKKLEKYGFKRIKGGFEIEILFENDNFKAIITVQDDNVTGKVFEIETEDEYLPLRVISQQGEYVGKIRESYENVLIKIRDNCFLKDYFVLEQSNRITNKIAEIYGTEPEFLWEKYDDTGIFRNKKTDKWFGIIMDIDKSKIEKSSKGFIEVTNVKLSAKTLEKTLKFKGFYPAYHMNKKYWITFTLDDTINDDKIMELIEESYMLVDKK